MQILKILVIGSKGFIGSHVFRHFNNTELIAFGADIAVDYGSDNYILIDAINSNYDEIFRQHQFDLCVNCSGAASVPASIDNPSRDFSLNAFNVFKILDAVRKNSPDCKVINLSSAAVYGNPVNLPVKETDPLSPMSPYGFHKRASEQICEEFHRFFGLQVASLRIFSAYGEGLKKQLFWDLHKKAQASERVDLFGSGKESRDFIYIGDLVRLIEIVAVKSSFNAEVINAANGIEITIKEAASTFIKHWKPEVEINFTGKERKGDPSRWVADISKAKAMGYEPQFTLKKGLKNYCQWLRAEAER
ncbi:MAG: NAD-dependent epimerase/dehydratase family protein [Mameliella sp.]|nr:NAD-dependent epimerase/dehydratase family protein [Phaeodactylibacter sp.]